MWTQMPHGLTLVIFNPGLEPSEPLMTGSWGESYSDVKREPKIRCRQLGLPSSGREALQPQAARCPVCY